MLTGRAGESLMDKVSFTSEGLKCAAFLGIPKGAPGTRHPAIVLGHGFECVDQYLKGGWKGERGG